MINRKSALAEAITETEIMVPLSPKTTIIYIYDYMYIYMIMEISPQGIVYSSGRQNVSTYGLLYQSG